MQHKLPIALLVAILLAPDAFSQTQQSQPSAPQPGQSQRQEETPSFRRLVELANVVFTVVTRRQKFVTDLEKENFRVFEDGKPQEIRHFSREVDLPLRVGLLLDTSNSIRERFKFEQEAAIDFLHNVVRRKKDQAFLMTFDNEPSVIQEFTDDLDQLTRVIQRQRVGGATALYDAIYFACRERLTKPPMPPGKDSEVRRVLVVISDGEDTTPGGRSLGEAIEMCQRAEVAIHTISTNTEWLSVSTTTPQKYHKTEGDKVLEQMAGETGGRAFFPYRIDDLAQSFMDIGLELRSQYSLAYAPTNRSADGKFRTIRIEVDRKGLTVRARKGYYAPRAPAGAAKPAGN